MTHRIKYFSLHALIIPLALLVYTPATAIDITECSFSLLVENVSAYKEFGFLWAFSSTDSLVDNLLEVHTDPGWNFTMQDDLRCRKARAIWVKYPPPGVSPGDSVQFGFRIKGMVDRTVTRKAAWLRPTTNAINPEETLMPILLQDFNKGGFYIIDQWLGIQEPPDPVTVYPKWAISPVIVPLDSLTPGNSMLEGLDWTVEPPMTLTPTTLDSILIPALSTGASAIVMAPLAWAGAPADTIAIAVNQCVYLTTHLSLECLTPSVGQGDTIIYDVTADNQSLSTARCDIRSDLKLPGGGWYPGNPLLLIEDIRLQGAGITTVRDSIPVPAALSPGDYKLLVRIGYDDRDDFFSSDSMQVEITIP